MKNLRARVSSKIQGFFSDRDGAVAILVASGIVVMVATIGMATDAARAYLVKARLAQALDAAALAGGRNFFHPDRDSDIRMYFNANLPQGYLGAQIIGDPNNPTPYGPLIVEDTVKGTLTLSASAKLSTTFMKIVGQDFVDVASSTEVTRFTRSMDIVIAIDMSGSMNKTTTGSSTSDPTQTRIHAARGAAKDLVAALWGNNLSPTHDLLTIGVVPWNGQVNVSIDGSTYDPDPASTSTAPATPNYDHPITGAPVSQHFFVNNSPVPLLHLPPGDTPLVDWDVQITRSGSTAKVKILGPTRWDTGGFSVGGTITFSNAENSSNDGTFTIVGMSTNGKEISLYPASGMTNNNNDTTIEAQSTYNFDGCVYARYIHSGSWPNADAGVDFTDPNDPAFNNDADTVGYTKAFGSRQWAAWEPITGETDYTASGMFKCTQSLDIIDCGSVCLSHGITPLTNVRADIEAAIDALQVPEGSTNIPQGLAWAFRVLMPGPPFNQSTPSASLTSRRTQAIILLTDGQNQNYWGNAYKGIWGDPNNPSTTSGRNKMNERLLDLAAEIKGYNAAQGNGEEPVEIYTIMFLDPNSSGLSTSDFNLLEGVMKSVATRSTPPYYHNAPTQAELAKVFKEIAIHLSALRISQ